MPDLQNVSADFFKSYLIILKYFRYTGINIFDETNTLKFKFKHIHIITFTIFCTMTMCHWRFLIDKLSGGVDFLELSVDLSFCYNSVEGLILFLYLHINRSRIQKFVLKLEKEWREDSSLLPHVVMLKRKQVDNFDRFNDLLLKSIDLYRNVYMTYPLLVTLVQKYIYNKKVEYRTPLKFTMPFGYKDNIGIFIFFYFIDYMTVTVLSLLLNCSLIFLVVSMNQMRILFILLQKDFKEIIQSKDKDINIKLKRTIQRHSKLTGLLREMGSAWGAVYAIHIFFLMFTVCFYTVAAKINKRFEDFKNLMIGFLSAGNTFYCSLYGQYLVDSAQDVASTIYGSSWENLSIENKKIILFTMLRSQRIVFVKSTSFTRISLESFIMIMKMAWSFLSLITTVYEK